MGPFFGVSSQWDNVSVTGRARGGRTHRDTEEGEAEEQAAKEIVVDSQHVLHIFNQNNLIF